MEREKRGSPRKRIQYPARIALDDGSPPRLCALFDVSETGARVALKDPDGLPERVTLVLSENGAQRRCRVVWRDGNKVGLQFLKVNSPKKKPPPQRFALDA